MIMTSDSSSPKEKSVEELFAATLDGEYDDERPWDAVNTLRSLGTSEIFQEAVKFCNSLDPIKRARGIDVMAQLGKKIKVEGPHFDERVSICLHHISDSNVLVVRAAAFALAHFGTEQCVKELMNLADHTDTVVREAAAFGLNGQPEAAQSLIKLVEDEDDDVRNWATFSLGAITTGDTPEIRDALKNRLNDSFSEVSAEAMWGLALRKDPIGVKLLLDFLESDAAIEKGKSEGDLIAAAETLGVPYDTPISDLCAGLRKILEKTGTNGKDTAQ